MKRNKKYMAVKSTVSSQIGFCPAGKQKQRWKTVLALVRKSDHGL